MYGYRCPETLLVVATILGLGCAPTSVNLPVRSNEPEPILVRDLSIDSILFLGASARIAGRRVGGVYGGRYRNYLGPFVTNNEDEARLEQRVFDMGKILLDDLGYDYRIATGRAPPPAGGARFALTGTLDTLSIDVYESDGATRTEMQLAFTWNVLDLHHRYLVYSKRITTSGTTGADVVGSNLSRVFADPLLVRSLAFRSGTRQVSSTLGGPVYDSEPHVFSSLFERAAFSVVAIVRDAEGISGLGSAFIIAEDGLALTNRHVVEAGGRLHAGLRLGYFVPARVIRVSRELDAALIDIDCEPLCLPLRLAAEREISLGDDVLVIGTPQGLLHSISKGIVSGIREMEGHTWIQTDAAINPGNSGGPLIHAETGKAIGIVTQKGVAVELEGLGFAISVEDALRMLEIDLGADY